MSALDHASLQPTALGGRSLSSRAFEPCDREESGAIDAGCVASRALSERARSVGERARLRGARRPRGGGDGRSPGKSAGEPYLRGANSGASLGSNDAVRAGREPPWLLSLFLAGTPSPIEFDCVNDSRLITRRRWDVMEGQHRAVRRSSTGESHVSESP